jgi:subfamily B ATP-binding cassette protein MsbA
MHLKESLGELMRGRTTFIVSHRMSLTEIAGRVVAIEAGEISEIGTHAELVAKGGIYRTLLDFEQGNGKAAGSPGTG